MLKLVAIYGANTALTRAITLLSALYLSRYYTLADIGSYGLAYTFSQLVVPVLSLGSAAAIIREGIAEPRTAVRLVRLVATVAAVGGLTVAGVMAVTSISPTWVYLGFLLGAADTLHAALISFYQSQERAISALLLTSVRVLGLLTSVALAHFFSLQMMELLWLQVAISFGLGGGAFVLMRLPASNPLLFNGSVRIALAYSVITVPHSVALWLISGSDRMWLAKLVGKEAVGAYTLAYTVGQVALILNSGVAAAMATRVARDYEHWKADGVLALFLETIGRATVGILLISLAAVQIDVRYLHLVKWPIASVFILASVTMAAFFVSNFYISYAAFLFYHRNTWAVTIGTLVAAPLTVGAMYILVLLFGAIGAAFGTMTGYILMAGAYLVGVRSMSGEFRGEWLRHAGVAVKYASAMIAIGVVFQSWLN